MGLDGVAHSSETEMENEDIAEEMEKKDDVVAIKVM